MASVSSIGHMFIVPHYSGVTSSNNNEAKEEETPDFYYPLEKLIECPVDLQSFSHRKVVIDSCGHSISEQMALSLTKFTEINGKYVSNVDGKFIECPLQQKKVMHLYSLYPNPVASLLAEETIAFITCLKILNNPKNSKSKNLLDIEKSFQSINWPFSIPYMKNPVTDSDGHTFDLYEAQVEKSEVATDNNKKYYKCPIDGKLFSYKDLYPNLMVQGLFEKVMLFTRELTKIDDSQLKQVDKIRFLQAKVIELTISKDWQSLEISNLRGEMRQIKNSISVLQKANNTKQEQIISLIENGNRNTFVVGVASVFLTMLLMAIKK